MKAVIVLFLGCIYLMAHDLEPSYKYKADYSFEERVGAFKKDGIIYCLDGVRNGSRTSLGRTSIVGGYDPGYYDHIYYPLFDVVEPLPARKELELYVMKKKSEIHLGNLVYVAPCLEIYDSKEYQDEVERIVKKYCKICK
ncbi:hypothetical protein CQA53_10655 [Helicobacter didelphidarum]|uniref:Uncharacterized protein n=1 Tax=Helicobacter didelphidarum TaxID=2040648 RepID=A0A3D8I7X7_9HELI|nr:hypothetical protein [Helicobacter didelphidarum]RDU60854.1 hypothetical protein CQA53_10655 [Helicobacter didelphidarum]